MSRIMFYAIAAFMGWLAFSYAPAQQEGLSVSQLDAIHALTARLERENASPWDIRWQKDMPDDFDPFAAMYAQASNGQ